MEKLKKEDKSGILFERVWNKVNMSMKKKLIITFLIVKVIPLIVMAVIALYLIVSLGNNLKETAVNDSVAALNASAVENIERMTTDTAKEIADFLSARDSDILFLAGISPSEASYRQFIETKTGKVMKDRKWVLSDDGASWVPSGSFETDGEPAPAQAGGVSENTENDDRDGFHYVEPSMFYYESIPLYDEITFVDLNGNELIKVVAADSPKKWYPMDPAKKNVSLPENTYVKAETYFKELKKLKPGEIYVSDVIGAYVGTDYIGMYTPENVAKAAADRGYDIKYDPEAQAYAGMENPNGQRFEGIIRWATPVTDAGGNITGYVTFALNHDHIMEFVDHITPMNERYTELPSAYEGNYAFLWDYKCRNIAHPRHHSIVGYDPETGKPQVPWLESSIYDAWQASGIPDWTDFTAGVPEFDNQTRDKKPAPELTKEGLVGLDGRYLNNAPQCTGWMNLTADGGSGSFYIVWSGLYKLTTAAAIPYYTGQYAPSPENGYSRRGFGFVTIGAGIDDFTHPAMQTKEKLEMAVNKGTVSAGLTIAAYNILIIAIVVLLAIWLATFLTRSIKRLIVGIDRFREGERQFRFNAEVKDEFGILADSFDDMADSIVDSVKNPLVITDAGLKVIYVNDIAFKIISPKSGDNLIGRYYSDISVYPKDSEYDPVKALEEGRESSILYVENDCNYIRGKANYLFSKDSEKIGYMIESFDLTDMVLKQIELEQAVENANKANEAKGEFLARMSHEIRTPMNAIVGVTKIVQKKLSESNGGLPEIGGNMEQIETSSQHLLGLLNDVLDISKIEAGKIVLADEVFDIRKLANTVKGIIKPRCDEKNIRFVMSLDTFAHPALFFDVLHLRQVLINLLGNAVKFTPELGEIEFRVEKTDEADGEYLVRFVVRDTGIGISSEAKDSIFMPFEQGNNKISRLYGGTGLGLAISRRIVNLFGSDIVLNSEVGKGSEFSFEVWLKKAEDQDDIPAEKAALDAKGKFTGRKALLVDDVDINRMIVAALLEDTGIAIDEAADGDRAVELFADSPEGGYDIIFMDVQMPVMDGFEATAAIRGMERADAAGVPIIALTANAFKEDIDKALSNGMNAHITKPVEVDRLIEVMYRFLKPKD